MKRALLDANMLVLLAVGNADLTLIGKHKRTSAYAPEDHTTLVAFLDANFGVLAATPHALSEASNIAAQIAEPARAKVSAALGRLITILVVEEYVPSAIAVNNVCYPREGLSDAAMAEAVLKGYELVTVDLNLYLAVLKIGANAHNFNHIRPKRWR